MGEQAKNGEAHFGCGSHEQVWQGVEAIGMNVICGTIKIWQDWLTLLNKNGGSNFYLTGLDFLTNLILQPGIKFISFDVQ